MFIVLRSESPGGEACILTKITNEEGSTSPLILASDPQTIADLKSVFGDGCNIVQSFSKFQSLQLPADDRRHPTLVLSADTLSDGSALDVLAHTGSLDCDISVIVISRDTSMALPAMRAGALDFVLIATPADLQLLPLTMEKCQRHLRVKQENDRLHHDLLRSLSDLAYTNSQLQSVIHQLESMARTDELTGLANRRWFNLMLHGNWAEATRHNLPLACMMIDLDGFKSINDRLGHHKGDDCLRLAAKVIQANCRQVDVPARYGGDEFCILMPHTQPEEAAKVAERLLREFAIATRAGMQKLEIGATASTPSLVSMSIGVSHINVSHPLNPEELVAHADEAMYTAKAAGKHRVVMRSAEAVPADSFQTHSR